MKKMNKKGFTIVELVIVIAVIAILAAVMIPTFSNVVTNAKQSAALQKARNYYTETLSKNLSDTNANNDAIGTAASVIVEIDGIKIEVAGGQAKVATGDSVTTNYKVEGGVLVPATSTSEPKVD